MEHPSKTDSVSKENRFSFFQHTECEYFPCHETEQPECFNCLFCYCPLYTLGDRCGGSFTYLKNGVKDCKACLFPHRPESYAAILHRFPELADLAKKTR